MMRVSSLLATMNVAGVEEALGSWMPPAITGTLLLAALALLWRVFAKRLDKMEGTLEVVKERLPLFATREDIEVLREQTRTAMGSLGDRMDARISKISDRTAVLENDLGKEIAVRQAMREGKQ